jgi:hypothetical protein
MQGQWLEATGVGLEAHFMCDNNRDSRHHRGQLRSLYDWIGTGPTLRINFWIKRFDEDLTELGRKGVVTLMELPETIDRHDNVWGTSNTPIYPDRISTTHRIQQQLWCYRLTGYFEDRSVTE